MEPVTLPPEILAMETVTAESVAVIDAFAKTIDDGISVTFDEERVAPPRRPKRVLLDDATKEKLEIERLRRENPGPSRIAVRWVEKLSGDRRMRPVALHKTRYNAQLITAARIEETVLQARQAAKRDLHVPTEAEMDSRGGGIGGAPWDYDPPLARHHSLMGTLCPESVADDEYVRTEVRLNELREIIAGDWHTELARSLAVAKFQRVNTERRPAGRGRDALRREIGMAQERKRLAAVTTMIPPKEG